MKDSLLNLQRGIGSREYSAESEENSRYHWYTSRRPRVCCAIWELLCLRSSVQAAGRYTEEAGPSARQSRRDRETVASSGTTGSDSTTGIHWGIGGWREACSFFFTWRTTIFFLSFISSSILLSRSSSREEDRKVVHAFRAIAPPQSVLSWYSCCSCLKVKEEADWPYTLSRLFQTFSPLEVLTAVSLCLTSM